MKKILITLSLLIYTALSYADNRQRMEEANGAYVKDSFEKAASIYEQIVSSGEESEALYYNLGNTYYKLGKVGPAILNYERALLLDPDNEDVLYNLEMAKAKTVDKIDTIDRFFLLRAIESVSDWFSSNAWAYLSIVFFVLFLVLLALYFFSGSVALRKASFFVGLLMLILTFTSAYYSSVLKEKFQKHEYAIIFSPSVSVKSSPDDGGKDIFLLHEGTKVKVKQDYNGWLEIKLNDGTTGWVHRSSAERI